MHLSPPSSHPSLQRQRIQIRYKIQALGFFSAIPIWHLHCLLTMEIGIRKFGIECLYIFSPCNVCSVCPACTQHTRCPLSLAFYCVSPGDMQCRTKLLSNTDTRHKAQTWQHFVLEPWLPRLSTWDKIRGEMLVGFLVLADGKTRAAYGTVINPHCGSFFAAKCTSCAVPTWGATS